MTKAQNDYVNYVVERLSATGEVWSRAMFGGYGIFHEGVMFAVISGDTLYFKVDDSNRDMYVKAGSSKYPHGISYWEVPTEVFEDTVKLHEWANISINVAHAKKKKRR